MSYWSERLALYFASQNIPLALVTACLDASATADHCPGTPARLASLLTPTALYRLARPLDMDDALRSHGLSLAGTHHRGIDDARNIARITSCMLADGWKRRYL